MWPFSKPGPTAEQLAEAFLERLERVEREMKALRADQDDWIDRMARLQGRISKRAGLEATPKAPNDPGASQASPEDINTRIRLQRAGVKVNGAH